MVSWNPWFCSLTFGVAVLALSHGLAATTPAHRRLPSSQSPPPQDYVAKWKAAQAAYDAREYASAEILASRLVRETPARWEALYVLANARAVQGKLTTAAESYAAAKAMAPEAMRADIDALLRALAAPVETSQPSAEDIAKLLRVRQLAAFVERIRNPGQRAKQLAELLVQTENLPVAGGHRREALFVRATAALELNDAASGWPIAKELRRIGAAAHADAERSALIARLARAGWDSDQDPSWRLPRGYEATKEAVLVDDLWSELRHVATGVVLALVRPGAFTMGSPPSESARSADETAHPCSIRFAFYLGKTEVTQAQWRAVMHDTNKADPSRWKGNNLPVEQVSWHDCVEFAQRAEGGLRLPTECEWEYACRAGTATAFSFGQSLASAQANFDGLQPYAGAKKGLRRGVTVVAGSLPANPWGLHEMHGNVAEWCQDGYSSYPASGNESAASAVGGMRMARGGSCLDPAKQARSAARAPFAAEHRHAIGVRLARSAPVRPELPRSAVANAPTEPSPPEGRDGAQLFTSAVGIGGGGGGRYGMRSERRKSKRFAAPVAAGLEWLQKHQDEDGKWDCDGFMKNDDPAGRRSDGPGNAAHDVGVTALALMAFLGDGSTLKFGRHKEQVRRAVQWLCSQQDPATGRIGTSSVHDSIYDHAIATVALVEAWGASVARDYRDNAQRAVDHLQAHRNPAGVWRYTPRGGQNDTSLTSWCVMACASGEYFGLKVDEEYKRFAASWFDAVGDATGMHGYTRAGEPSSRMTVVQASRFPPSKGAAMTAAALFCRFLLDQGPRQHPIMLASADYIVERPAVWDEQAGTIDMYYWYFASQALRQMGGDSWSRWQENLATAVVPQQHQEKAETNLHGSWDPKCAWGSEGGRVYSTAMMVLCLQSEHLFGPILSDR